MGALIGGPLIGMTSRPPYALSHRMNCQLTGPALQVVYFRAQRPGACDYVRDSRFWEWGHGACWSELTDDLEVGKGLPQIAEAVWVTEPRICCFAWFLFRLTTRLLVDICHADYRRARRSLLSAAPEQRGRKEQGSPSRLGSPLH